MVSDGAGVDPALLRRLAADFGTIERELSSHDPDDPLETMARVAASRIPGADWASITSWDGTTFTTIAASDDRAAEVDEVQHKMGDGPCVAAVVDSPIYHTGDLGSADRWEEVGRAIRDQFGVRSVLSFRLPIEPEDTVGALTFYGLQPDAFASEAIDAGLLLAAHCSLAVTASVSRHKVANLQRALESSREIGVAIGIVMATYKLTRDQAFSLLRIASQHRNQKLRELASDVALTGELPLDESILRAARAAGAGERG